MNESLHELSSHGPTDLSTRSFQAALRICMHEYASLCNRPPFFASRLQGGLNSLPISSRHKGIAERPRELESQSSMISYALRLGRAFTGKRGFNRCLRQATTIPQNHWISTVNNARLWYLEPLQLYLTEKPYHINLPAIALGGHAQSNEVSREYAQIRIEDLRGSGNDFTLHKNGFQIFQDTNWADDPDRSTHSGSAALLSGFYEDPDSVRKYYYPAIENLLKEKLGAKSAKAFTHDVWPPPYIIWDTITKNIS